MRLIVTLVSVLIIALLVSRQLQSPPAPETASQATSSNEVPSVPTRPQDVPQFEEDINSFINQAAEDQARQIEEATNL